MINIEIFFKEHNIEFESEQKKVAWIRSLSPKTLVKVGKSYFINSHEIDKLFQTYLEDRILLRKKRGDQARKNFKRTNLKKTAPTKPS